MFLSVIADDVDAAILRVSAKVFDVDDRALGTADQCLQLGLVEHGEPRRLDDVAEASQEGIGLTFALGLETEGSHAVDV